MVETAKANGLIPFDYLMHIFKELPTLGDDADLEHLLPWNVTLPQR
ncbi:MAG: transposase domain-containing protein [Alteromonadaceae bacterium]|nr:transposase domain-containing protein [Alteromonadaceae bacterium]